MSFIFSGSNNLRFSGNPFDLVTHYKEIASFTSGFKNWHLVFTDVVPSPKNYEDCYDRFATMSHLIENVTKDFSNCSFFKSATYFIKNNGIDTDLYKADNLHLNQRYYQDFLYDIIKCCIFLCRGAAILSEGLKNHCLWVANVQN